MPRSRPPHVGSAAISAVTCVMAKTKTRSKKSSSGETRLGAEPTASGSATRAATATSALELLAEVLRGVARGGDHDAAVGDALVGLVRRQVVALLVGVDQLLGERRQDGPVREALLDQDGRADAQLVRVAGVDGGQQPGRVEALLEELRALEPAERGGPIELAEAVRQRLRVQRRGAVGERGADAERGPLRVDGAQQHRGDSTQAA